MKDPLNLLWTEKWRPKLVKDVVGDFRDKVTKYLENPNSLPHFLLFSRTPGTGKTSLAKAIFNELNCDYLIINSSDDRKIDVIRDKVKQFALTKSSKEGLRRGILLDEADGLTPASQDSLRNIMETYASNCFFILTANRLNKIIKPLQSRCQAIPFAYPNKEEVYKYLVKICDAENLKYTEDGLKKVITLNYPSIRNCVLLLQDLWTQEKEVNEDNVVPLNPIYEELWGMLKKREWREIKKVVLENTVDARELNMFFWEKALKDENIHLIQIFCRNERDMSYGSEGSIILVTSLIEACK